MSPLTLVAGAFQLALVLAGLAFAWQHVFSPAARAAPVKDNLPPWRAPLFDFLLFLGLICAGLFVGGMTSAALGKVLQLQGDVFAMAATGLAQVGMIVATAVFGRYNPEFRAQAPLRWGSVVRTGVVTFLISVPLVHGTGIAWEALLKAFDIPAQPQDLIRLFAEAESPLFIVVIVSLAVILAPISEELIFRAGIFRFLRHRVPKWIALLLPGIFFAALHVNWVSGEGLASFAPLVMLALLYSLALERTGHIGTTIVAHALFNLNTVIMVFCGLGIEPAPP